MGEIVNTPYEIIFKAIRKEMGVTKEEMISKNRHRHICEARQMFCMLARDLIKGWTEKGSVAVGKQIERDHATVLYSAATMRNLCTVDKRLSIAKGYLEKDIVPKLQNLNKLDVPICEHCKQPIYEERLS
jgi:chromosomal replication initiation ATPase DnaA